MTGDPGSSRFYCENAVRVIAPGKSRNRLQMADAVSAPRRAIEDLDRKVAPTQGGSFSKVFLVAEHPIGIGANQVLTDPPYQFSITIPNNIGSARKYFVGATGIASSGQSGKALRIHLDVEPSVAISSIAVHPSTISFIRPGDAIPLSVAGTFTDGSIMDITQSSGTTYTSGDTTAVTVGTTGVVTAIGLGNLGITPVIAQYSNQTFSVQVSTKRLPPPSH